MKRLARAAVLVLCASIASVIPVGADVVSQWNVNALGAIAAGRPASVGPAGVIDLAMVHAAIHDAVQAYDQRFEQYAGSISSAPNANQAIVAAAKAARDVLVSRFPAQQASLDALYAASIAGIDPSDVTAGEVIGALAADNVIASRDGDGAFPGSFTPFPGGTGPGEWRPNPGTTGMTAPWLGAVRPFAIPAPFQPDAIPLMTSAEYAEQYNEVKALGSIDSTQRTPEQSSIARFFSGNFLGQYNRLMRDIAAAHMAGDDLASLGDRARLFALANIASADAIICAWESKKRFNFWRPIHAIRDGDLDNNILTEKDASWTPYFSNNGALTPNYPDYTSGANNFTGAMMRTLQLFFGDDTPFESFQIFGLGNAVLLQPGDSPRTYTRFSDVMKDVIDARIWLGIHFRFADTEARSQGRRVANYAFRNFLRPLN